MATIVTRAGKGSALTHDELDDNFSNINTELTSTTTTANAALPKTGGALTGALTTNSTIDGVDIAVRDGVLTSTTTTANAALPKSGGTMTGNIVMSGSETVDGVDISARDSVLTSTTTTANAALPKAGGTMTGAIAMGTQKITGLGDPGAAQDAATKAYVDANVSSVTASSTTTFTNKTIDANGTGNSITNLEVADLASGVLDTDLSSVSGSDDTLASAKAIKTYADTKLSDVISDTTPQLGGDLDVNGQSIVSTSNGNIVMDPNGTGAVTIEGDGTAAGNFAARLARLQKAPLVIDNNQSDAWWGSQLIMKDNSDDIFAMVGREDTSNKVYGYIITMDPNGTNTNSSSYAGDYGFYFNMQYEGGSGSDEWYMIHNVFGADDGYFINAYGSGHNSYSYTPLKIRGSQVELSAHSGGAFGGGSQGPALTVDTTNVDLNGLKLKDTSGSVTVNDNMTVNLDSGGTTALVTENESATASGNRITVGTGSTAHTSGDGFLVRRGTGSGFEEQFKVETDSSTTKVTARGLQLTGATVDSTSTLTQSNRLTININGTNYYIPLQAV